MGNRQRHNLRVRAVLQLCGALALSALSALLLIPAAAAVSFAADAGYAGHAPASHFTTTLLSTPFGKIGFGLVVLVLVPALLAIRYARLSAALKQTIADAERANALLRESEVLHRSILNASPEGITVTDMEGRIRSASPAALSMFRYHREDEVIGRRIAEYIVPEEHERMKANMMLMFQRGGVGAPNTYRAVRADGGQFDLEVSGDFIPDADGEPCCMVFIGRDVTEQNRAKKALEESNRLLEALSITDSLTGLANRRRFDEALAREHARHARSGAVLSLIMLDIDHFKAFNDSYGHVIGDDCLARVAGVIAACVARAADLPARYGGEEFACILPETDLAGAVAIAEHLRQEIMALAIPHDSSVVADCVTASLGVVTVTCDPHQPASQIVDLADQMLYKAKSAGRNRVEAGKPCSPGEVGASAPGPGFIYLIWRDDFRSGNPVIDSQHEELFRVSNELLKAMLSACSPAAARALAVRLLDHIVRHFHDEEAILKALEFPGLARHKEEHARLYVEGRSLIRSLDDETEPSRIGAILNFLVYEMVSQHMLGVDREFFSLAAATRSTTATPQTLPAGSESS